MDIQNYINEYVNWLKSEISFSKIGEYYEITTPYLDTCNDYLQLYVRQEGNTLYFTDDSATMNNLLSCGLQLTPSRKSQIKRILSQFGVTLQKNELTLKAPASDFPKAKHFFVQAMLRINDLYMTSRSKVFSYFLDDIQLFFRDNNIYCSENVQFIGKSGYIHNYDFLFQRSRTKPERLCVAINNPTRTSASNILFAWDDTKKTRQPDSCLIVFLNDENSVPKGMEEAFLNYGVSTILWSQRNSKQNIDLIAS